MSMQNYVYELSEEAKRLELQAQFLAPLTRRWFRDVGITSGMKVLDLGCGAGDVALLLAELVGSQGTVVGVDWNPTMLEVARERIRAAGLSNISFVSGDVYTAILNKDFDAAVGRFILIHVQDKVALLRNVSNHLRPGGILAFLEPHLAFPATSWPRVPLFEQAWNWHAEAIFQAGLEKYLGLKMFSIFLDAGLPIPELRLEQMAGGGPDWGGYDHLAGLVRAVLPLIIKFGIATDEEVAIDTLAQRMYDEAVSQQSVMMGVNLVCAWAQKLL